MTKEEIRERLNHSKNGANNRKLLAHCRVPRTYGELSGAGVKGDLFKALVELKNAGALAFLDGKYVATQEALEILDSLPK